MDQQATHSKQDSSVPVQNSHCIIELHPRINEGKVNPRPIISNEEMKIRGELEMDIERDLEQEIKNGIYHLAIKLHQLYQQQKERNAREISSFHQEKRDKALSEVKIKIRLEGETKVEIKESKKEIPGKDRIMTAKSDNLQGKLVYGTKKFDWAKSLRSDSGTKGITKKNDHGPHMNVKVDYDRRSLASAAGQRKGINSNTDSKLLELGWKF